MNKDKIDALNTALRLTQEDLAIAQRRINTIHSLKMPMTLKGFGFNEEVIKGEIKALLEKIKAIKADIEAAKVEQE